MKYGLSLIFYFFNLQARMQQVLEIEAKGNGLFKFDANIKAHQGERLELRRNPENEAGLYEISLQIFILLSLLVSSIFILYS